MKLFRLFSFVIFIGFASIILTGTPSKAASLLGINNNLLFSIDSTTGATTDIGRGDYTTQSIASDLLGNLYGVNNNLLFSIDSTTGATTDIGRGDYTIQSITFAPPSVVPLPPSAILFGTALLGLGYMRRRKRKLDA